MIEYLTDWTPQDEKKMQAAILSHFGGGATIHTSTGNGKRTYVAFSFGTLDSIMGFAYSSGSDFPHEDAMYSIANCNVWHDERFAYKHFVISEDGTCWALLKDEMENYKPIKL